MLPCDLRSHKIPTSLFFTTLLQNGRDCDIICYDFNFTHSEVYMIKKIPWQTVAAPSGEATASVVPSPHENDTDRLLCVVLDIGEHMLRSGGEVHRVEDSMERICHAYGVAHVEVFVITSLLIAAIRMPDGSYSSQMRRVYSVSKDLSKFEEFNGISRRICSEKPSLDEVEQWIYTAKKSKPYSSFFVVAGNALMSGGFALLFGGTVRDGIAAALVGMLLGIIGYFAGKKNLNVIARTVVESFCLAVLSILSVAIGIGENIQYITIGAIMLVIPGLDFGNSLRDLMYGNLLSGALRMIQAVMTAVIIAIGYLAAMLLLGGLL